MRTFSSLGLRAFLACAVSAPLLLAPVADALAGDEASRPDDKPNQPGKKQPGKKGKDGKGKDKKGPQLSGKFKKDEYPVAEQYRPLVLPNGMGRVRLAPSYQHLALPDPVDDIDSVGTTLDFSYGLGDLVELGVGTGLLLAPDVAWNDQITAHVHWLAVDTDAFDLSPGLVVPFTFTEGAGQPVSLDVFGRYRFADKAFLTFGRNALGMVVGDPFVLSLNGNAGLGYQVSREAVLFFDTSVFSMPLSPDVTFSGPWDRLYLGVGGQYTPSREVDLGLSLTYADTWDLKEESAIGLNLYGQFRF